VDADAVVAAGTAAHLHHTAAALGLAAHPGRHRIIAVLDVAAMHHHAGVVQCPHARPAADVADAVHGAGGYRPPGAVAEGDDAVAAGPVSLDGEVIEPVGHVPAAQRNVPGNGSAAVHAGAVKNQVAVVVGRVVDAVAAAGIDAAAPEID